MENKPINIKVARGAMPTDEQKAKAIYLQKRSNFQQRFEMVAQGILFNAVGSGKKPSRRLVDDALEAAAHYMNVLGTFAEPVMDSLIGPAPASLEE